MGPKPKIPVRERISPLRTPIREMPKVVCRKPAIISKSARPKRMKNKSGACFRYIDVNHCAPNHGEEKKNQSAAGIPKSWKIKFGAARAHRNDYFRMLRLRCPGGIGVAGLRGGKTEITSSRPNASS